jgi:hypothetical protein
MTLNEISSTIENNISDALSGAIANRATSTEQLEAEVDLLREKLVFEQLKAGKIDLKYFLQNIDSIKLECRDFVKDCGAWKSGDSLPSIKIPKLLATANDSQIEYIGIANMHRGFKVYYDVEDIRMHKYRLKTANSPFAWVDMTPDGDDMVTIYFFNFNKYDGMKFVSIRAAFASPLNVKPLDPLLREKEYPAPGFMQEMIISTLTERYIRYYRQLNVPAQPNTQTDNVV